MKYQKGLKSTKEFLKTSPEPQIRAATINMPLQTKYSADLIIKTQWQTKEKF